MSCISKDTNGKCELATAEDKKLYNVNEDGKCLADDEDDCALFTSDKAMDLDIADAEEEADVEEDSGRGESLLDD